MNITIIMPTYNEGENIQPIIKVLEKNIFPRIKNYRITLLIVDDYSPDGTANLVREEMKTYRNISLLQKKKEGLGSAYIKGFKYAMNKLSADAVIEMDADFQHDPKYILPLIKAFDEGFDCVLGSRFTPGGSIPKDWGAKRVFLSIGGNQFIRTLLGIKKVHDLTTGFRLTGVKDVLDQIDLDKLYSRSYAYKIHLLYEIIQTGAKIKEVPIRFVSRQKGWSKMDFADFLESLKVVIKIRLTTLWIRFAGSAAKKKQV